MRSAKNVRLVMDAMFEWLHTMEDSVDRSSLLVMWFYTLNQGIISETVSGRW